MSASFAQDCSSQQSFYIKGLIVIRPFFFNKNIMYILFILPLDNFLKCSLAIIKELLILNII